MGTSPGPGGPQSGPCVVTRIPRLPPLPPPPALGEDPRQAAFARVVGNLHSVAAEADMHLAAVNTSTGFHAGAVDVATLKGALEAGVKDFTLAQIAERWAEDVGPWMHAVARTWVQRGKRRKLSCEASGVHVLLETQDDHGHYRYEFDVFPGK